MKWRGKEEVQQQVSLSPTSRLQCVLDLKAAEPTVASPFFSLFTTFYYTAANLPISLVFVWETVASPVSSDKKSLLKIRPTASSEMVVGAPL